MSMDLTVVMEDRTGALAELGEALGNAGVNIEGGCATTSEGKGAVHILVADADGARSALGEAGIEVSGERQVLLLDLQDVPGELGRLSRKIASAGVNIDFFYITAKGQAVFGVADLERAKAAF